MTNDRKVLQRSQIRSPTDLIAVILGTFFGSGLLPKMPGTWGTLAAVPLTYWVHRWYPNPFQPEALQFWTILFSLGTWACKHVGVITGTADNQVLVIDEVVGYGICASFAGISWEMLIVCFFLFRIFDITKIPPVRYFDRLSKKSKSPWFQGFGVMLDDVLAGIQGLLVFSMVAPSLIRFLSSAP